MLRLIKEKIKKVSILEDLIEENSHFDNTEIILEEEKVEDISLFKIPKYLETVDFFNLVHFCRHNYDYQFYYIRLSYSTYKTNCYPSQTSIQRVSQK
jgi:hypothetical protein